ncbi:glycosyltransferase [Nonomuraea rubra]|uniref:glycosyltransferase n=1 Tax=Nonomuraea rubra TaxID=46180 RepID=UPI003606B8F2
MRDPGPAGEPGQLRRDRAARLAGAGPHGEPAAVERPGSGAAARESVRGRSARAGPGVVRGEPARRAPPGRLAGARAPDRLLAPAARRNGQRHRGLPGGGNGQRPRRFPAGGAGAGVRGVREHGAGRAGAGGGRGGGGAAAGADAGVVQGLPVAEDDDVRVVGEVAHERLFPRTAAVVHHGGAGTTGTALAAGVPNVVCPFFSDQPFWGRRVAALGAGPGRCP